MDPAAYIASIPPDELDKILMNPALEQHGREYHVKIYKIIELGTGYTDLYKQCSKMPYGKFIHMSKYTMRIHTCLVGTTIYLKLMDGTVILCCICIYTLNDYWFNNYTTIDAITCNKERITIILM